MLLGAVAAVVVNQDKTTKDFTEFEKQQRLFQTMTLIIAGILLFIIGISWIDAKLPIIKLKR